MGKKPERVRFTSLDSEKRLEDTLAEDISILSPELMLIGRQVSTSYGKYIDLLAINEEGDLVVIELKRNKTPREVVAQLIDYASWVQGLSYDEIAAILSIPVGTVKSRVFNALSTLQEMHDETRR